jgi:hypothetical protein
VLWVTGLSLEIRFAVPASVTDQGTVKVPDLKPLPHVRIGILQGHRSTLITNNTLI